MQRDAIDTNAQRADRFETRAKRQAVRVIRKIVLGALFLVLSMWAFIAWSLWAEYNSAHAVGRTEGINLSAAFALELTHAMDAADAALAAIDQAVKFGPPVAASRIPAGDVAMKPVRRCGRS